MRHLILITAMLLSPLGVAVAGAQNLTFTLAETPPARGVTSTRSLDSLTLQVAAGATVTLSRATGRDYQLQAAGGFFWTQVQEVPQDAESVVLTPLLQDDGSVEVALAVMRKEGTRTQQYSSTIVASPGQWVQLFGPASGASRSTKVYGTQAASQDSLYLRIEY